MMKARFQILFTLFFLLIPYTAIAQVKQGGIQTFLSNPGLTHASVGICVKDLSGKQLAGHNENKSYTPASILKVVTTATALETLGPDYTYRTTLATDKNNPYRLLVHGYGDPTLGTEHLDNIPDAFLPQWTEQIRQRFDPAKVLDITVIDNYFGYDGISERWIYQDMGNYYAAGSYGISIYDNTYRLFFNTTRPDTCPQIVKTEPEVHLTFRNMLTLNTAGQDNGYIHGEPFSANRLLTGNIPAGRDSFSIKGDIPDPGLYLGETLARRLSVNGFTIGKVSTARDRYFEEMYLKDRKAYDEDVFYTHNSYPLSDIIKDTNVRSNNHYAEHLIRAVGRSATPDIYSSALDAGIERTNSLWKARGLDTDALMIFDGSGLAPANAVSPAFMCDLLVYMQAKSRYAGTFLNSLPRAGKEGSVRSRLKGTRLEGKIAMKSGSIYGVQCFAGYYTDGDKKYAFTIMVNNFTGSRSGVVEAIDKLLLSMF